MPRASPQPPPSPVAERSRRYRKRQSAGVQVLPVEIDNELIERLIGAGLISPEDALIRHRLAEVVARVTRGAV